LNGFGIEEIVTAPRSPWQNHASVTRRIVRTRDEAHRREPDTDPRRRHQAWRNARDVIPAAGGHLQRQVKSVRRVNERAKAADGVFGNHSRNTSRHLEIDERPGPFGPLR